MSSLCARKVIKTYSRQRKPAPGVQEAQPPPTKRRCVAFKERGAAGEEDDTEDAPSPPRLTGRLLSSSPRVTADASSDDVPGSSPPSSPVPQFPSPPVRKRRPMFSFVKRSSNNRVFARQPMFETSHNIASSTEQAPVINKKKSKSKMVQMQLDLISEPNKTCKICGMEYVPSLAEDAALHRKFHAMNIGGVDISKAMLERLRQGELWSGSEQSFVAVVTRRDPPAMRNKAGEVLKVVNTELGAVPISQDALWSHLTNLESEASRNGNADHATIDRYRVYLYIQGSKCVAACLAERIQAAFPVLSSTADDSTADDSTADDSTAGVMAGQPSTDAKSPFMCISEARKPAVMGISRIWTSNSHRQQGIATMLLNLARSNFLYGMTVSKETVAFSQPTESGGRLARKWFGQEAGWLVYVD